MPVSELALEVGFVLQNPDRQLFASTVEEEVAFGPKNVGLSRSSNQGKSRLCFRCGRIK